MKQRFHADHPWEATDLFQKRFAPKLENGIAVKGKTSLKELGHYYRTEVDPLFEKIKEEGILTGKNDEDIEPIFIMINKNGELIYTVDGNHRLAICRVLGIKQMPVQVWKRHKKWQAIRDQILSKKREEVPNHLKQYLNHPDIRSEFNA